MVFVTNDRRLDTFSSICTSKTIVSTIDIELNFRN